MTERCFCVCLGSVLGRNLLVLTLLTSVFGVGSHRLTDDVRMSCSVVEQLYCEHAACLVACDYKKCKTNQLEAGGAFFNLCETSLPPTHTHT